MAKKPYMRPIFLWSTVVSQATRPVRAVGRRSSVNGRTPAGSSLPMKSDFTRASAMRK